MVHSYLLSINKQKHVNPTHGIDCDHCGANFDDFDSMREHRKLHKNRSEIKNNIDSVVKFGYIIITHFYTEKD